jgi:hypothetical protein
MVFAVCAVGFAGIACLAEGLTIDNSIAFALCIAMIAAQVRVLGKLAREVGPPMPPELRFTLQRIYVCLAMLFFGSLWISWQVEVALSRYAVPYLPLLILMLGIALGFWRAIYARARVTPMGGV